jgi:hypothetical protein
VKNLFNVLLQYARMLSTVNDIVVELKTRCITHRLAAENAERIDSGIKIPVTILAAIVAALAIVQTFVSAVVVAYVTAAVSCITFALNGVLAVIKTTENIKGHSEAARKYDELYQRCISENLLTSTRNNSELRALIKQIQMDAANIIASAPLCSVKTESQAKRIMAESNRVLSVLTTMNSPVGTPAAVSAITTPISQSPSKQNI